MNEVLLWGADGKPLVPRSTDLVPPAFSAQAIYNSHSKVYSFRWDEAIRDSRVNALAMRRDPFYTSLLQERCAPTINMNWSITIEDKRNAQQSCVRDVLTRLIEAIPDLPGLFTNLLEAIWYGRYGSQMTWGQIDYVGAGIVDHKPVNGDSIQFGWDGTPIILVSGSTIEAIRNLDPEAEAQSDQWNRAAVLTDAGAYGLRLYRQDWRQRFAIHKHVAEAADFFEGEMLGTIHGVGLRSKVYWADWIKRDLLAQALAFMDGAGMMDVVIVNYARGNSEAKKNAEAIASKLSKLAITSPRDPNERYPIVETVQANVEGIKTIQGIIEGYYDRYIRELFVGQTMSSGGGGSGGLEGDGRAELASDTKYQLVKTDAKRLAETINRDIIAPMMKFNFPVCPFRPKFAFAIEEREKNKKVETGLKLMAAGVAIVADELREPAGFSTPGPGDEIAGQSQSTSQLSRPVPGSSGTRPGDNVAT